MPSIKSIETPEKTLIRHVLHATTGDQRYPCKSAPTHGSSAINTTPLSKEKANARETRRLESPEHGSPPWFRGLTHSAETEDDQNRRAQYLQGTNITVLPGGEDCLTSHHISLDDRLLCHSAQFRGLNQMCPTDSEGTVEWSVAAESLKSD